MIRTLACLTALQLAACAATISDKDRAGAKIRYDIAVNAMEHGDLRAALRDLLGAVEADPELVQAHNALGLVYHAMGRQEDALTHYREAVRLAPKFSEVQNNMGVLLLDLGRYDDAILAFKVALSDILYATPFIAEGNMGWAFYKKGDATQGLKHLRNAVATNPKFCRGYGWLAQIELELNDAAQAVAYAKRFEKHCLEDAAIAATVPGTFAREMKYYLGRGYQTLGDVESSRQAFAACATDDAESDVEAKCARGLSELR
ncbi:MAG: tetratricopeptide repeat protein [Deltaproteobacteria bacterium]|nr:tetratricopeptide repeat protein [Deltaproteobacteria bacterium]